MAHFPAIKTRRDFNPDHQSSRAATCPGRQCRARRLPRALRHRPGWLTRLSTAYDADRRARTEAAAPLQAAHPRRSQLHSPRRRRREAVLGTHRRPIRTRLRTDHLTHTLRTLGRNLRRRRRRRRHDRLPGPPCRSPYPDRPVQSHPASADDAFVRGGARAPPLDGPGIVADTVLADLNQVSASRYINTASYQLRKVSKRPERPDTDQVCAESVILKLDSRTYKRRLKIEPFSLGESWSHALPCRRLARRTRVRLLTITGQQFVCPTCHFWWRVSGSSVSVPAAVGLGGVRDVSTAIARLARRCRSSTCPCGRCLSLQRGSRRHQRVQRGQRTGGGFSVDQGGWPRLCRWGKRR